MIDNDNRDTDWDDYSASISTRKDSAEWAVLRSVRANHYRRFFTIQAGERVLDAGCGHGEYSIFAARDGAHVCAIDTSAKMLDYTERACARARVEVTDLAAGSVTDIPFPRAEFDTVMCLSVLESLHDPTTAIAELVRVLKPGGTLYLDVCNANAVHWRAMFLLMQSIGAAPKGNMRYFKPSELKHMVAAHGMHHVAESGQSFSPPFSGLYTADLRRYTVFPNWLIQPLDRLYVKSEDFTNHRWPFSAFCWHYFLRSKKALS